MKHIDVLIAGNMKCGMRVVDAKGVKYEAFSSRFAYLEVFPIGPGGKPEIFAGNSVFFHLDPTTASAYPNRRHDPIFLCST
jgi:hypothetical protein